MQHLDFIGMHEFDALGLSVGAGIEKKVGRDWSLRAEYRYTDFGETAESFSQPVSGFSGSHKYEDEMHIGRISVCRKLGR